MHKHLLAIVIALACCLAGMQALAQTSGNAFNPDFSLILNGRYANYSNDPETYGIAGFALGEEAGLAAEGLAIDESEMALSANVDDKFYGFATIAFVQDAGETAVELEEAWIETTALPQGLKLKVGRFLSDIGYLNATHSHAWDFADAPLAYSAMLGGGFGDSGVQLRWVVPVDVYFEIGGELMRGDSFPAAGADAAHGQGAYTAFAHLGGDVGASNSWRAGLSYLSTDAHDRESPAGDGTLSFEGDSDTTILDFVWKWAKNGNTRDKSFVGQFEYLRRSESGSLIFDNQTEPAEEGVYTGDQDGWYVQGVYQFRPRWRVGLRFDRLGANNQVSGILSPIPLTLDHDPQRQSVMVDFSNSEFSRFRLQWNRDESMPETDDQLFLQYIMSMGAHGAHRF